MDYKQFLLSIVAAIKLEQAYLKGKADLCQEILAQEPQSPLDVKPNKTAKPKPAKKEKKDKPQKPASAGSVKPKDITDEQLLSWYREIKTSNITRPEIEEREGLSNSAQLSNMFYSARKRGLFDEIDAELANEIEEEAEND